MINHKFDTYINLYDHGLLSRDHPLDKATDGPLIAVDDFSATAKVTYFQNPEPGLMLHGHLPSSTLASVTQLVQDHAKRFPNTTTLGLFETPVGLDAGIVFEHFPALEHFCCDRFHLMSPVRSHQLKQLVCSYETPKGLALGSFPNLETLNIVGVNDEIIETINQLNLTHLNRLYCPTLDSVDTLRPLNSNGINNGLHHLEIGYDIDDADLMTLAALPWARRLKSLQINRLRNATLEPINTQTFPRLHTLSFTCADRYDYDPRTELLEVLRKLRHEGIIRLHLSECCLTIDGIRFLCRLPIMRQIKYLNLDFNCLDSDLARLPDLIPCAYDANHQLIQR